MLAEAPKYLQYKALVLYFATIHVYYTFSDTVWDSTYSVTPMQLLE